MCAIFLDQRKIDDLKVLTRREAPRDGLLGTWSMRLFPVEFDGDFLVEIDFVGTKDELCL